MPFEPEVLGTFPKEIIKGASKDLVLREFFESKILEKPKWPLVKN